MAVKNQQKVFEFQQYRNKQFVFRDRAEAGQVLSGMLEAYRETDTLILAIPDGGVPVAVVLSDELNLPIDVAVVSKVTPQWNTEVGFGAVAFDGTVRVNQEFPQAVGMSNQEVQKRIAFTKKKVRRREKIFRGGKPLPKIAGRVVLLVDDGLATGSTMSVAVESVRKAEAKKIIVAVPTAHQEALNLISKDADELYCANVRSGFHYAVAQAYKFWTDVTEPEAAELLSKLQPPIS